MSNNLDLDQLVAGQSDKETTVNTATGQLDAALTEAFTCDLSAGNVTLTSTQFRRNIAFRADGVATSGRKIIIPASIKKLFIVENEATSSHAIIVQKGTSPNTQVTVAVGEIAFLYADGTATGLIGATFTGAGGGISEVMSVSAMVAGAPTASQKIAIFVFPFSADIASGATGSQCESLVSATAQTDFLVKKNGSTIGTIRWAISGTIATYVTFSATSFAAGDIMVIEAPVTPDATLADIAFSLKMTRTSD